MEVKISKDLLDRSEESLNNSFNEFILSPSKLAFNYLLLEMYEYARLSYSIKKMIAEPDDFTSISASNIMYFYKDKDVSYIYFIESWKEIVDNIRVTGVYSNNMPDDFTSISASNIMYFYKDKDVSYIYFIESWKEIVDNIRVTGVYSNNIISFFDLLCTYSRESNTVFSDIFPNTDIVSILKTENLSFVIQELLDRECVVEIIQIFVNDLLSEKGNMDLDILIDYTKEKLRYSESIVRYSIVEYLISTKFVVSKN